MQFQPFLIGVGAGISSARIPPSSSPFVAARPDRNGWLPSGLSIRRRIFPAPIDLISLMRKAAKAGQERIPNGQIIFPVRVHIEQAWPGLASLSDTTEKPEHDVGEGVFQIDLVAAMPNEGAEGIIRPACATLCRSYRTIPHRLQGSL